MDCPTRPIPCWATGCRVSHQSRTDEFTLPQSDGPDRRLTGLPQFVTVLGGAYFFLPGIRALRFFSTVRA